MNKPVYHTKLCNYTECFYCGTIWTHLEWICMCCKGVWTCGDQGTHCQHVYVSHQWLNEVETMCVCVCVSFDSNLHPSHIYLLDDLPSIPQPPALTAVTVRGPSLTDLKNTSLLHWHEIQPTLRSGHHTRGLGRGKLSLCIWTNMRNWCTVLKNYRTHGHTDRGIY